jgi:hypothetical protein
VPSALKTSTDALQRSGAHGLPPGKVRFCFKSAKRSKPAKVPAMHLFV